MLMPKCFELRKPQDQAPGRHSSVALKRGMSMTASAGDFRVACTAHSTPTTLPARKDMTKVKAPEASSLARQRFHQCE